MLLKFRIETTNLRLTLLSDKTGRDKDKDRIDVLVIRKGHVTIGIHGATGEKFHIIVLGKDPLAESRCGLSKGLDFRSSDLVVLLELCAKILAKALKVFLNVFLAHGDFVQVETNSFVNDVVHHLDSFVNGFFRLASKAVSATNIDSAATL